MKTRAVRLGTQLVEHERALDRYFLKGNFSNESLKKRLTALEKFGAISALCISLHISRRLKY